MTRSEVFDNADWNKDDKLTPSGKVVKALAQAELDRRRRIEDFRIEALRAASRVVAAQEGAGKSFVHGPMIETMRLAEHFALWLETGEQDG